MLLRFEPINDNDHKKCARLFCPLTNGSQDEFNSSGISIADTIVRIPDSVLINGEEHTVTAIGHNVFEKFRRMRELYIPKSVTDIKWSFYCCLMLQQIHVDEGNEVYKDVDGVLYTKDGKTLIAVPNGRRSYTIPNGVEKISSFALKTSNIEELEIPESVIEIGNDVFYRCQHLKEVKLPDNLKKIGEVEYDTCVVFFYKGNKYSSTDIIETINNHRKE